MKRYIILGALLLSAAFARANLGDNYATICQEHGGVRGKAVKDWVYWSGQQIANTDKYISDAYYQFKNNKVVAISWKSGENRPFIESEVWRVLILNSGKNQLWHEYSVDDDGWRFFCNADSTMYAELSKDGTYLQIAYKSWIDRHDKWKDENAVQPPAQEDSI